MSLSKRLLPLSLTLAAVLLSATPGSAQRRKLNGPLATTYLADVGPFALSASGRIVYRASAVDLFSVPLDGSAPVVQIQSYAQGQASAVVFQVQLTPDGTRVVERGDLETDNVFELFSVPTDGSQPFTRIHPAIPSTEDVLDFVLSPDGERAVYRQGPPTNGITRLYSTPIDGSAAPALLSSTFDVDSRYRITPDSEHVLFSDGIRLFTIPIAGGVAPLRVHPVLGGGRNVQGFALTPDGSRVVYTLDYDTNDVFELYSALADGSAVQVKLNGPLAGGGDVGGFAISPDSARVTFTADASGDEVHTLYAVSILGGTPVALSPAMAGGRFVREQVISPDSARVVYLADQDTLGVPELYGAPLDGSQPAVKVSGTMVSGGGVYGGFLVDPSSTRVVFRADRVTDEIAELFSAPLDGSAAPLRLNPSLAAARNVGPVFQLAAGGARAVFTANPDGPLTFELFSAPLDGSAAAIQLHPALVAGGFVGTFLIDDTSLNVLYAAEQEIADLGELFSVPADGSQAPALRSNVRDRLVTVGDVQSYALAADGAHAVYLASQEAGTDFFAVNLAGHPQPVQLGALGVPHASGNWAFALTPDSTRVVYRNIDDPVYFPNQLYSVPLDASAAPVQISSAGTGNDDVTDFQCSPDASRVVYLMSRQTASMDDPKQLFSAPVDGGSPPVELNLPRAYDGGVQAFQLSPDATRVVYKGIQQSVGGPHLYSVPTDGGAAPVKLDDTSWAGVSVDQFSISADSSSVVFRADGDAAGVFALYRVALAGGAPVELEPPLVAGGDVASFALSPDSARVVYLADQSTNDRVELYSVPIGGGTAVLLSTLAIALGDVTDFALSPDSAWVVYRADPSQNERFELFAVPIAGGTPIALCPTPLANGGDVAAFVIDPSSRYVAYHGDVLVNERTDLIRVPLGGGVSVPLGAALPAGHGTFGASFDASGRWVLYGANPGTALELFAVPLEGQHPPISIAGPLPAGANSVYSGAWVPGRSAVVYRAEQEEAGVFELYENELLDQRAGPIRRR